MIDRHFERVPFELEIYVEWRYGMRMLHFSSWCHGMKGPNVPRLPPIAYESEKLPLKAEEWVTQTYSISYHVYALHLEYCERFFAAHRPCFWKVLNRHTTYRWCNMPLWITFTPVLCSAYSVYIYLKYKMYVCVHGTTFGKKKLHYHHNVCSCMIYSV